MQHPKHRQVYEALAHQISGGMTAGERLPSEADLVRRFGASRITVGRALRDLQMAGLVERRAGSGTFVRAPRAVLAHAVLRRVDSGGGRGRGVRRDLSRPAGGAGSAPARAGVGEPAHDHDLEGRPCLAPVRAVRRAAGGRRLLRAHRADRRQGHREPAHRRCPGRRAHSRGAHRPRDRAVPQARPSRSGGAGQPSRRRDGDRASALARLSAPGVSWPAQRGQQRGRARSGVPRSRAPVAASTPITLASGGTTPPIACAWQRCSSATRPMASCARAIARQPS